MINSLAGLCLRQLPAGVTHGSRAYLQQGCGHVLATQQLQLWSRLGVGAGSCMSELGGLLSARREC